MSNRDVVAELYDAFARRDIAAIVARVDPAITVVQTPDLPWGGAFEGVAGLQRFFGLLTASVDSRVEVEEYVEASDRVVAVGWTRGQVRANGAPFDIRVVHVWTIRDGRALRFEPYIDTPGMLRALGMGES
ncbi:MAG TPA: nuclear transport factor 2 family protein [Blastocatellia bacterium]|nr:nuclear transport factor 2 family protein [Blastocatellia bacterium]